MAGWTVERMRIFLWQNIFGGPSCSRCYSAYRVQVGVVAWISLVQPESLSRFAVLPVAREELDGGEGKNLVWQLVRIGTVMAPAVHAERSETPPCPLLRY